MFNWKFLQFNPKIESTVYIYIYTQKAARLRQWQAHENSDICRFANRIYTKQMNMLYFRRYSNTAWFSGVYINYEYNCGECVCVFESERESEWENENLLCVLVRFCQCLAKCMVSKHLYLPGLTTIISYMQLERENEFGNGMRMRAFETLASAWYWCAYYQRLWEIQSGVERVWVQNERCVREGKLKMLRNIWQYNLGSQHKHIK